MAERLSTGFVNAANTIGVKPAMTNFTIHVYSGTQPDNADLAENGVKLLEITVGGLPFVSGQPGNGLNFGDSVAGVLSKAVAEEWKGVGLAAAGAGTQATWFRAYANTVVTGASETAVRFDGQVGTTTAFELKMSTTIIGEGVPCTVSTFKYTAPRQ